MNDSDPAEYSTWQQHMVSQGSDVSPAWSPDGWRLAFVSYRDGNSEIYLLDLRTGELRNLTNHPGADTSPVWSPDGKRIVFQSKRGRYWDLYMINLETGEMRSLTNSATDDLNPVWAVVSP